MYKKLISVLLAVLILTSLLALPADAASYSSAFNCLKEFAMQGTYDSGDNTDFYVNAIALDDYGNYKIGITYYVRAEPSCNYFELFTDAESTAPVISLYYYQKNEDRSECWTMIRFTPQQRDSCTVALDISPGNELPGCMATATIHPSTYKTSAKLSFERYDDWGAGYMRETYQEYMRASLALLLEYARKILVENGSDLQSLGFSKFDQHTVHAIDYSDSVILHQEPRCNSKGIIEYSCAICGQRILEYLPMTPGEHNWDDGILTDPPSCKTEGKITYTCVWCGEKKYEYLPPDPDAHVVYGGTVEQEPTCTEDGTKTGSCFFCMQTVTVSVPALGHLWDEGEVAQEPGCTEDGVWQCTCVRCGETEEEAIPNLGGHLWTFTELLTEAEEGGPHACTGLYTCSRCSETKEDKLCAGMVFKDMPPEDFWSHDSIDWAWYNGITGGTGPDTFSPDLTVTRSQVVTFLWAAAKKPAPETATSPFTDVKEGDWFLSPVLWAVEHGVTGGIGNSQFGPNAVCTRAQIVTFLWAAAGKPTPKMTESPFTDVKEGDWYLNAVLWAVENGVTGGVGNNQFGPDLVCTRAQAVTFLYKASQIPATEAPAEP